MLHTVQYAILYELFLNVSAMLHMHGCACMSLIKFNITMLYSQNVVTQAIHMLHPFVIEFRGLLIGV